MNMVEKNSEKIKTSEEKEELEKWAEKYIAEQQAKNKKIQDMMANTDYVKWLTEFTQDKEGFSDDQWIYFPEKISPNDRENVEMLNLFYEGIDKYAKQNYIYPTQCDFGNFYRVKLNSFGFEIGVLAGQGTAFFFKKISLESDKRFIDFNDIMNKNQQNNVDKISAILDFLSKMIITAYENEVPIEAIVSVLDNTIKNIDSKKKDKPKILVRK